MKLFFFNCGVGAVGCVISLLFGEWSELLTLLFFAIIIDYLTGVGGAIINGNGLSSAIGYKGIIKKFAIVLIVVLSYQLDKTLGLQVIMSGTIYFFLANELISIVENYGKMNLPLPPQIKNIIHILKEKK